MRVQKAALPVEVEKVCEDFRHLRGEGRRQGCAHGHIGLQDVLHIFDGLRALQGLWLGGSLGNNALPHAIWGSHQVVLMQQNQT